MNQIQCAFRRFTAWGHCEACGARQRPSSFLTTSSTETTIDAQQLQDRKKGASGWLGYRAVLETFWVPGDQVFAPASCRDPVNRLLADAYLSSVEQEAYRWRVYHNDQLVLVISVLPQQPVTMQPTSLTREGWARARRGDDFLTWLYKGRGRGRPPLEADPDGYWLRAVRQAEECKRKYPKLNWPQVAVNIGVNHEQLRKWRRKARTMQASGSA